MCCICQIITTSNTWMWHASSWGFGLQALCPHGWSWCWNCFGHCLAALAIFFSQKLGTFHPVECENRPAEQALAETLLSRLDSTEFSYNSGFMSWGLKIATWPWSHGKCEARTMANWWSLWNWSWFRAGRPEPPPFYLIIWAWDTSVFGRSGCR